MENTQTKQQGNGSLINVVAAVLLISALIVLGIYFLAKPKPAEPVKSSTTTYMTIYNHSKDTVTVYVTLGRVWGCLQNVLDIPFVLDTVPSQGLIQGYFALAPGDSTIQYAPDSLGYNGVISFNHAPDNCPALTYTNGLNQFEFMINNNFQPGSPQETVDISCVHGVNCVIRVNLDTQSSWNAGPTFPSIQSFANTMDKNQIGTPGVYPYGCDTCTASKSPPTCIPLPQPAQKNKICNVQRDAVLSGGVIKVIYLGKTEILK